MRLAIQPGKVVKAFTAINHPNAPGWRPDKDVALTASADGLTLETNGASAFVPAQVAIAGGCAVDRDALLRVLRTFPRNQPLMMSGDDGKLVLGRLRMPARFAFTSRGNDIG
jgi:hypothetical protein